MVPIPTTKKTKDTGCVRLTFEKLDVECLVNCDNCPIKPSWQVEWNCIFSRIFCLCLHRSAFTRKTMDVTREKMHVKIDEGLWSASYVHDLYHTMTW